MIYWSMKGCFSVGEVPIKELGAGVSNKLCLVAFPSENVFLKSC